MKVDFTQVLLRRRFSIERWLESEGITNTKGFKNWMKNNEVSYTFSQDFVETVKSLLTTEVKAEPMQAPEPVKNALVELPVEEPKEEEIASSETVEDRPKSKKNRV